ncbi:hypothetical protein GCM10011400_12290 [Paraburkholderia caffeinilytica]|uniref:Uncharacterized protein n=1 Tax=Paraburkholderia caffeinilytica TaxID=1761016 RepID=A0ABQ1LPA4_9BURK|nr:hypothetical protein GCM10011400_12290 [Paraburkholderia caffeinilytica]
MHGPYATVRGYKPPAQPGGRECAARTAAYTVSVPGPMLRWLMKQRFLLANPFAGVKVRGARLATVLDTSHTFAEGEWTPVHSIVADLNCLMARSRRRRNAGVSWTSRMRPPCA